MKPPRERTSFAGSRPEVGRTVFKSGGTSMEELAAAILVYEAGQDALHLMR
jgi:ornithine cyclodeaminase/alanine dehydrogenase-like protein (mu-crystallin family)